MENTITISLELYNEYITLKERQRQIEKHINRDKFVSKSTLADIFDVEIPETERED